jgi:hypothetical protein
METANAAPATQIIVGVLGMLGAGFYFRVIYTGSLWRLSGWGRRSMLLTSGVLFGATLFLCVLGIIRLVSN